MPKDKSIKRVLVIGSGPIVIGQAAEFDYAGTQACRALKEEGLEVILVNSKPLRELLKKKSPMPFFPLSVDKQVLLSPCSLPKRAFSKNTM